MTTFQRFVFYATIGIGVLSVLTALVSRFAFADVFDVHQALIKTVISFYLVIFPLGFFSIGNTIKQVFAREWRRAAYSVGLFSIQLVNFFALMLIQPGILSV